LSGQFLQESLFAAVDTFLGAIVTSHTLKCDELAKIRENYCGLTILITWLYSRVIKRNFWPLQNFDLWLFVSYFASQSKVMNFGNYFFDMCCVN